MAEEKIKLEAVAYDATMTAPTRIQTMEADVKIEAKYAGEVDFVTVSDTTMARGEVKSYDGQWEAVPADREMVERRVTITPKNIAWYKSRMDVRSMPRKGGEFMGSPGEKFTLEPMKARTMKVRKDEASSAKSRKLAAIRGEEAGAVKSKES
tara:strand:- start:407 stop:862 length:456 start_codon:yes stop_codon:yes gene_type:complete